MGFKEDTQFARYVTMGAVGARHVAHDLRDRFGHHPVELERDAMANKIWAVSLKRMRVPDLVCIRCGRRAESKAKTKLEVKLSHSSTAGREWDAGGMRPSDLFAFVRLDTTSGAPAPIGVPAYFTTGGLRRAVEYMRQGGRKAWSEGSEADVSWPVWVPSVDGIFVGMDGDEIFYDDAAGKRRKYWHSRDWPVRHLYLASGDAITAGATIGAGVPEPPGDLSCAGAVWDLENDLIGADPDDRYAAIRGAGASGASELASALRSIAGADDEDWRIRLEAMASLARIEPGEWTERIEGIAGDLERDVAEQMEAVFILSEMRDGATALEHVAARIPGRHEEVRSAAVWGLGTGACAAPERAIAFAIDPDDRVALHAAAAAPELPESALSVLDGWLRSCDVRAAAVSAAILAQHHRIDKLIAAADEGGTARLWALQALGEVAPDEVRAEAGALLTPELETALAPLWVQHDDWLRTSENEGALPVLAEQHVRFDPLDP